MSKLGLPFEYQISPEFFDAYNLWPDTEQKNSIIEGILKKHMIKNVLDITCGTGSQVFYLAKRGYKVIGADFSPALLKIARKKAIHENMSIKFIDADMRTLQLGQFDAVISIFNAVGHLSKPGFKKALRNINQNLNNNGIYIFDIMNLDAMTDEKVANLSWHIQKIVGNTNIHGIQCSIIDRKKGLLSSFDHVVLQKNANKPLFKKYKFSLQIYTANELVEILERAGFEVIEQRGFNDAIFVNEITPNILTVARKKPNP